MSTVNIPCMIMRGGTSRGTYFLKGHLPKDETQRNQLLSKVMGASQKTQIDGVGGASAVTNKVAIISVSDHDDADVDYLFAQVSHVSGDVDVSPTCGNILSGVAQFAIERGLVIPEEKETTVRIRNVNTNSIIESTVQTPGGIVTYEGDAKIDGVVGKASPVFLNFRQIEGAKTGKVFPTGNRQDEIDNVMLTCIDVAMPMVLFNAESLGLSGYESKEEIEADKTLMDRIEKIRKLAAVKMGMGDVTGKVIPKVGILASAQKDGHLNSRYLTPDTVHPAHAVSGAICVASASLIDGTVANALAGKPKDNEFIIEHLSGKISIFIDIETSPEIKVHQAGVLRTARKIFDGTIFIEQSTVAA